MNREVILAIPDELYRRFERKAAATGQDVAGVLIEVISRHQTVDDEELTYEPDEAVEREEAAYQRLHPMLWQKYPNEHVAIYGGKLVDHDVDGIALSLRIYQRFPNEFVLLTQVEAEPNKVLQMRSPRFAPDSK
jgi:hypothetical protein